MWHGQRALVMVGGLLLVGAPLLAVSDPTTEELEQNRLLLEKIRQHPEHYARLVQDLNAFRALPPERQAAIRQLDHDLHEEDSATTARLNRVLERYTSWFDHLNEADRHKIEAAPNSAARLQIIKELRQQQWIEKLPRAYREELQHLQGQARADRIDQLHKEEKKRHQEWQRAFNEWFRNNKAQATDGSSELTGRALYHFAMTELTAKERADLNLSPADLSSRERLKQEYIKRHPAEWKKLQQQDQQKVLEKPKKAL